MGVVNGVALSVAAGWIPFRLPPLLGYGVILVAVAATYVALAQSPRSLAERMGFIRRNFEREYDAALTEQIERFNTILRRARELGGSAGQSLRDDAAQVRDDLRRLHAPDSNWDELAGVYGDLFELHLRYWGKPLPPSATADFARRNAEATALRDRLRQRRRMRDTSAFRWP